MPSSPESTVSVFELADLTGVTVLTAAPAPAAVHALPMFEVARAAGIPDDLLHEAREAARAAGYAAGWSSGIQAAKAAATADADALRAQHTREAAARQATLRQALITVDRAASALESRAVAAAEQVESLILSAALDIAEALVGSALRDDTVRGRSALARALSLAPDREAVEVRLHPVDHAALVDSDDLADANLSRTVTLVADAALRPGDAIAHCGATVLDARIASGLARVREVLAS